jgi:23S rRNA (cytidine1920-2'-O)/16S rRNA (cytidine1409-2'-O)-methyltransferase
MIPEIAIFDKSPLDKPSLSNYPIHMTEKKRLDILLVERGLAESRNQAQRLIMAGEIRLGDRILDKPGIKVPLDAEIIVKEKPPFVSRGGLKLEAALTAFDVPLAGVIAADVGASTGGFTDCLLQHGVARVYAIDVGHGQLAWKLRTDPRLVVLERTNARYLTTLPEPVDLATIDVSFISLNLILPAVMGWLKPNSHIIPLIKPQFEAEPHQIGKGGVVKDKAIHRQTLRHVLNWAADHGLYLQGLIRSPITGPAGNVEFLAHLTTTPPQSQEIENAIARCLATQDPSHQ